MSTENKIYVYCYGTLRPGLGELVEIPGVMYDLGWFPGVNIVNPDENPSTFFAERVEVDEEDLYRIDNYEGYHAKNPESSYFKRVPLLDGYVYIYNDDLFHLSDDRRVPGGDWLKYKGQKIGSAARFVTGLTDKEEAA